MAQLTEVVDCSYFSIPLAYFSNYSSCAYPALVRRSTACPADRNAATIKEQLKALQQTLQPGKHYHYRRLIWPHSIAQ